MKIISAFTAILLTIIAMAASMMTSTFTLATNTNSKPITNPVDIRTVDGFTVQKRSGASTLYSINVSASTADQKQKQHGVFSSLLKSQTITQPDYSVPPLLLTLKGNRTEIGYAYADMLAEESAESYFAFLHKVVSTNDATIAKLEKFLDFLWDEFYSKNTPQPFLDELQGMTNWANENKARAAGLQILPRDVAVRFLVLANMPADSKNIVSCLENTLEKGWPSWLKTIINDIIKLLEKLGHKCDAFGISGGRTNPPSRLYSSRNLDFSKDTGIDKYKLIISYDITDGTSRFKYASIGFTVGLGALAGMSQAGISTSEMNLDNSRTDFRGLPFPLRLRYVLEGCDSLKQCMTIWNSTTNTNSFNFLIGSGKTDKQAYALETIWEYTGQFPANSPIEADSTYDCGYPPNYDKTCDKWIKSTVGYNNQTSKYGKVKIGFPLPDAVWRTNHGMNPVVMKTQEPLFNGTVYRYKIAHDVIQGYENAGAKFEDVDAVNLVATMGTKGPNFFTCDGSFNGQFTRGDNIMSIVYVPGEERMFVAWERGGALSGGQWRPAACSPYVHLNMTQVWSM